ncbi:HAD family hydrolase [Cellulomonas carbonis]|uniref:HAD family hydrolase n=1 Tax=Cellulomonas carbonis TaxID=1386092 RepID=UPI001985D63C|nr:HAD family phosphatase [Cellulomonas carbonis]GGB95903.1 hypothetical protein GCM10010972_05800 [Cellulomonas carbonis]
MPATPAPVVPDLPAAVLWDMDGTLVDTEPAWIAAETALVQEFGGTWTTEDALRLVGLPLEHSAALLAEAGVTLPTGEIVERLIDGVVASVRSHTVWQPGARRLLEDLRDAGVPCALVTMSYRRFAEEAMRTAPEGVLTVMVTGDEVSRGKPDPEPYLRAAEVLGVDVTRCVAIEDSRPGIASALASGARTLGVQHLVPVEPRDGLSRVASLEDVDLAALARIGAGEVLDRMPVDAPGQAGLTTEA